jgi:hypothetical protein
MNRASPEVVCGRDGRNLLKPMLAQERRDRESSTVLVAAIVYRMFRAWSGSVDENGDESG